MRKFYIPRGIQAAGDVASVNGVVQTKLNHAVEQLRVHEVSDLYAWCHTNVGGVDAITFTRSDIVIDLDGLWGHLNGYFFFKDELAAIAFKMRWG